MRNENRYFDVYPKIVPANSSVLITIRDRYGQSFLRDDKEYEMKYFPLERFSQTGEYKYQEAKILKPHNGTLKIQQFFTGEQEHIIEICEKGNEKHAHRWQFRIYSLEPDLFCRKPYKGDMHMHTHYSDGYESPAFVTASCRKIGLDFMAITDHRQFYPSIESQEAFKDLDLDMLILRGEEVHPPFNPVHMINFGGNFSINELIKNNEKDYYSEVEKIKEKISEVKDEDARFQCASCIWTFERIRQGGGLGIFCHPYWQVREGYYISDTVISYLLKNKPFDAMEIISGYYRHEEDSNTLQVARYHEERAKGNNIPVVGVSDSHGCVNRDLFGWYYTIVFSPELKQEIIIKSIKELYSVAVEAIPGESPRAYGDFRLVKYALYLMREIFPDHDEICFDEGKLMLRYLEGNSNTADLIEKQKGRVPSLYDKLWAKE